MSASRSGGARQAAFTGWWADGQSAARRAVRLERAGGALHVSDQETGEPLARLAPAGLRLADAVVRPDEPLRLMHRDWPGALLTTPDHGILERLGPEGAHLRRGYAGSSRLMRRALLTGGVLVALVAGMVAAVPLLAGWLAPAVPQTWMEPLGDAVITKITREYPACDGADGREALHNLVTRLAEASERTETFRLRVVDDAELVNAAAAPGGHMVLFSGLIHAAEDADEVAAVLAHEMAHVIERHPTEGVLRHAGYQLMAAAVFGDFATMGQLAGDAATEVMHAAHSRSDEADADRIGMELLHAAGIDSRGMAGFFDRLAAEVDGEPPRLIATHPPTEERLAAARQRQRPGEPALSGAQWQALQEICDG